MSLKIDPYKRQQSISLEDLYPSIPGKCACGCDQGLTGRRKRWATDNCVKPLLIQYFILRGDMGVIRRELRKRDQDENCDIFCAHPSCKVSLTFEDWDADHILAVCLGGGGMRLENYQILCKVCHKRKTKEDVAKSKNLTKNICI